VARALAFLLAAANFAPMVYVAHRLSTGSRITLRGVIAYLLVMAGLRSFSLAAHHPGPGAYVQVGFAAVLWLAAALIAGWRPVLFRRATWVTAPAVVLAVEPVKYRDVVRWKIRFAYFDPEGVAQESADEVVTGAWKVGDECLAVFQPDQPDLATMRPVTAES
jgi:hypothetical protein